MLLKPGRGGLRNRSVTPIGRIDASQARTIAEEQTNSLEEGLKQASQPGSALSILLQDDFHAVTAYGPLPSDVVTMVANVGMCRPYHWLCVCVVSQCLLCVEFRQAHSSSSHMLFLPLPASNTNSVLVQHPSPSATSMPDIALFKYLEQHKTRAWTLASLTNRRITRMGFAFASSIRGR
ncbi:hypothetical protein PGT21_022686 [Puccinia graminis f. sp. tritici]|uniref:Uncharacterized protein n=1 Tax=Puccinia graminis f. sp. tritici TaxID=56615 RepID=A0A5B0MPI0_PUCGR|nr:hypothetical protein PGT21_022686 [Puccinia graminis f. sp. tritici]